MVLFIQAEVLYIQAGGTFPQQAKDLVPILRDPLWVFVAVCGTVLGHIPECPDSTNQASFAMKKVSLYKWGAEVLPDSYGRDRLVVTLRDAKSNLVYQIWKFSPQGVEKRAEWEPGSKELADYGKQLMELGSTAVDTALAHVARGKDNHNHIGFLDMVAKTSSETYVVFGEVAASTTGSPRAPRTPVGDRVV